jgi:pSer/pThr/pTyr-binding forkhead associated (FHA) protein
MASIPRPQLVFVGGPQRGERQVLMGNTALLGRSPKAEIRVNEQYVSRRELRFMLTRDGWVVQSASGNPVRINGKKYRGKKRILLGTGDVIDLGASTHVLFVAAGDHADAAVRHYRELHPDEPPSAEAAAREGRPEAAAPGQPPPLPKTTETGEPTTRPLESDEAERRKKRTKYLIFLAVDVAIVLALVIWFSTTEPAATEGLGRPRVLTGDEIERALKADLDRPRSAKKAEETLAQALFHHNRQWKDEDAYLAVKRFKEHLAYRHSLTFAKIEHRDMFVRARDKLTKDVDDQYRQAVYLEQQGNWPDAHRAFQKLLLMVPEEREQNRDEAVFDTIVMNARKHLAYVNRRMARDEAQ